MYLSIFRCVYVFSMYLSIQLSVYVPVYLVVWLFGCMSRACECCVCELFAVVSSIGSLSWETL